MGWIRDGLALVPGRWQEPQWQFSQSREHVVWSRHLCVTTDADLPPGPGVYRVEAGAIRDAGRTRACLVCIRPERREAPGLNLIVGPAEADKAAGWPVRLEIPGATAGLWVKDASHAGPWMPLHCVCRHLGDYWRLALAVAAVD